MAECNTNWCFSNAYNVYVVNTITAPFRPPLPLYPPPLLTHTHTHTCTHTHTLTPTHSMHACTHRQTDTDTDTEIDTDTDRHRHSPRPPLPSLPPLPQPQVYTRPSCVTAAEWNFAAARQRMPRCWRDSRRTAVSWKSVEPAGSSRGSSRGSLMAVSGACRQ